MKADKYITSLLHPITTWDIVGFDLVGCLTEHDTDKFIQQVCTSFPHSGQNYSHCCREVRDGRKKCHYCSC